MSFPGAARVANDLSSFGVNSLLRCQAPEVIRAIMMEDSPCCCMDYLRYQAPVTEW